MLLQDSIVNSLKGFSGRILKNEPLARHTYLKVGGSAKVYVVPKSIEDLVLIRGVLNTAEAKWSMLGAGSNVLYSDDEYDGLIIDLTQVNGAITSLDNSSKIEVGASVRVVKLLNKAVEEGWGGLEFLAGIPGTLGGVVAMNGGTHLGEIKDYLEAVSVFSLLGEGGIVRVEIKPESDFAYRRNKFLNSGDIVYSALLNAKVSDRKTVASHIHSVLERRKSAQPVDLPSCGSVFKNPVGTTLKSWQVIDQCGLRGFRIGNAEFSKKHCNFIVNLGGAKAQDIYQLIQCAKTKAMNQLNVVLEEEVRCVGF